MGKRALQIVLCAFLAVGVAACGGSDATPEPTPTTVPLPTEPPSPTAALTEEPQTLDANVVGDTTLVTAGETFVETWRIRNTGDVDWDSASGEFRWTFIDGDQLDGPDAVPILGIVPAGEDYEIAAEFTAPAAAGQYEARWQLLDSEGAPVGPTFSMLVTVQEAPTEVAEGEEPEETPEPTPAATEVPAPEYEEGCLDSYPVSDVTIPDGTQVEPGETFTKIWRIRNTGTCAWDEADGDFMWTFIQGEQMDGPDQVPIVGTVEPDEEYDVEIELTAPTTPGEYRGVWQLYDPNGEPFGVPFWVLIEVPGVESTPAVGGVNLAQEIWQQINGERARENRPQLGYNDLLAQAAQAQADDCSQRGSCSHTGSDGSDEAMRASRVGFVGRVDEAWAMAISSADAVQWWMEEVIWHRPMLLSTDFNEAGVGVAPADPGYYFIAVFGRAGR
jgi:uncharacterized protein YkwD